MENVNRIGEVIQASSLYFKGQCDELYKSPPFGGFVFVKEEENNLIAIIDNIETSSIDPGRISVSQGEEHLNIDQIYDRHPELNILLRTTFEARVICTIRDNQVYPGPSSTPPRIHSIVQEAIDTDLNLVANFHNIVLLISQVDSQAGDDFISSAIRHLSEVSPNKEIFLETASRELVNLFSSEPIRLNLLISKIKIGL